MTSALLHSSNAAGACVQQAQRPSIRSSRSVVRCQAAPEIDSRRKVLGFGLLLATTLTRPAFAEDLAKPSNTGGEKVKAPKSAPTSVADAPKPTPTADIKEGGELIAKLTAQSEKNKALNDRKRLTTSYANFENSRTVADGSCTFPRNLFGCGNRSVAGKVKYISDDQDIECEGKPDGKCGSKIQTNSLSRAFKLAK